MILKEYINIANLPTKIEKLERLSIELGKNIYIKRDDQTGSEISGNKIRKLEFLIKEALNEGCDYLITCGGIQSNHARATTAIGAKLGLKSYLVLRGKEDSTLEGNLFLNRMLGAEIKYITADEYRNSRMEIMKEIKKELELKGHKALIIPEGASNAIGSLGYAKAMEEILAQEKDMNIKFDSVVTAVGSGGTYAGLYYMNKALENPAIVYGVNVCDDEEYFKNIVEKLLGEMIPLTSKPIEINRNDIKILDGYVGLGYALSTDKEIAFLHELAKKEGLILDPVYTGKAMYGLVEEIKKGTFDKHDNILFIHTGGIFGWSESARNLL